MNFKTLVKAGARVYCFIEVLCPFCGVGGMQARSASLRTDGFLPWLVGKMKVLLCCRYFAMYFLVLYFLKYIMLRLRTSDIGE